VSWKWRVVGHYLLSLDFPLLTLLLYHNSIALYRETWPVTLNKEFWLKMYTCTVQICGCKSKGITGDSGRWHNEELHDLYLTGNQIKHNEMHGTCTMCGREKKSVQDFGILVGKPERKIWLHRTRHRWVENITRDLTEIGWEGVD